jgi:hypothetical protein
MHRQAMLVSLSLSPASAAAATHNKHWAFLVQIPSSWFLFFLVPSLFLVFSGFGFIFCSVWIASRVSYGALPYCDWL